LVWVAQGWEAWGHRMGMGIGMGTVIHGLVCRQFSPVRELLVRRLFYGRFMDMPAHIRINPCSFGLLPAPPPNVSQSQLQSPLQRAVITSVIYTEINEECDERKYVKTSKVLAIKDTVCCIQSTKRR